MKKDQENEKNLTPDGTIIGTEQELNINILQMDYNSKENHFSTIILKNKEERFKLKTKFNQLKIIIVLLFDLVLIFITFFLFVKAFIQNSGIFLALGLFLGILIILSIILLGKTEKILIINEENQILGFVSFGFEKEKLLRIIRRSDWILKDPFGNKLSSIYYPRHKTIFKQVNEKIQLVIKKTSETSIQLTNLTLV